MVELCEQDLEWLETVSRDEHARALFLRMDALSRAGRIEPFLAELNDDGELDAQTKWTVTELAREEDFLRAVADYLKSS
jgi:hypothetical protein